MKIILRPKRRSAQILTTLLTAFIFLFIHCKQAPVRQVSRDLTITPVNAVTRLYMDSVDMEKFISLAQLEDSAANRMRNFYNSRNFQFAWFSEKGLAEQTRILYDLDKNFRSLSGDSSAGVRYLQQRIDHFLKLDTLIKQPDSILKQLEFKLTDHFFSFIADAYAGKIDPARLQWYIPRKKIDAVAVLDSLLKNQGEAQQENMAFNAYYFTLRQELTRWSAIATGHPWPALDFKVLHNLKAGDSSRAIAALKSKLIAFGAMDPKDTSGLYTRSVDTALRRVQLQFGQQPTGKPGATLIRSLNVPVKKRIEQILINLERMRWVPVMPQGRVLLVNIPEFRLHAFENRKEVLNMSIVVGKEAHQTVIFSHTLKNIVFSPYWNVPSSIVKSEILPAIRRNSKYLRQHQMEIYGKIAGLPLIRQKPGNTNSLGRVKFLFPNSYEIYLHDTPSKSLFSEQKRAFSHGCIRLSQPAALATYLLEKDIRWNKEKIALAMHQPKETWVQVKQAVPVFITYFTTWVDKNGRLNFRDDIYGHDAKMAELLFPQPPVVNPIF